MLCTEPLLLTVPDTPWAIFMVCVSEWYLPASMRRSEIYEEVHAHERAGQERSCHGPLAKDVRHLLSLPFIMASSEPMPRYFFTLTPFCSK